MAAEHAARRASVAAACTAAGVDGLLVTDPVNIRYLSGFTGSNGTLLVTLAGTHLATDARYDEQARRESPGVHIVVTRAPLSALLEVAPSLRVLAVERNHLTMAAHQRLLGLAAAGDVRIEGHSDLVETVRLRKDAHELGLLRAAAACADAAFGLATASLAAGTTERALASALDDAMRALGASSPAFDTIVAAGRNGSEPHHRPSAYAIGNGDLVTIDMGALVDGYHSDMTRTIAVGEPAPWQREVYAVVQRAQLAGRAAVVAGVAAAGVDAAARAVIDAAGYGERFVHGVGHGVGLQIHEGPMLFGDSDVVLAPGMVVTVEPGIYLPGRGGVRIEDTVVVGSGEILTNAPYDIVLSA